MPDAVNRIPPLSGESGRPVCPAFIRNATRYDDVSLTSLHIPQVITDKNKRSCHLRRRHRRNYLVSIVLFNLQRNACTAFCSSSWDRWIGVKPVYY